MENEKYYELLDDTLNTSILACMYRVHTDMFISDIQENKPLCKEDVLAGICGDNPCEMSMSEEKWKQVLDYINSNLSEEDKFSIARSLLHLNHLIMQTNNEVSVDLLSNYRNKDFITGLSKEFNFPIESQPVEQLNVSSITSLEDFYNLNSVERHAFFTGKITGYISQHLIESIISQATLEELKESLISNPRDTLLTMCKYTDRIKYSIFDIVDMNMIDLHISCNQLIKELMVDKQITEEINKYETVTDETYNKILYLLSITSSPSIYISNLVSLGKYIDKNLIYDYACKYELSFRSFQNPLDALTLDEYKSLLMDTNIKLCGKIKFEYFRELYPLCIQWYGLDKINEKGLSITFDDKIYTDKDLEIYAHFMSNFVTLDNIGRFSDSTLLCQALAKGLMPFRYEYSYVIEKEDFNKYIRDNENVLFYINS